MVTSVLLMLYALDLFVNMFDLLSSFLDIRNLSHFQNMNPSRRSCSTFRWGFVSLSPNIQAGGPHLVGCPRPLVSGGRLLHPHPEDVV